MKSISITDLNHWLILTVEICGAYRILQSWKILFLAHVSIMKSTPDVDLQHHMISTIEIWRAYRISHFRKINFSLHVHSAKSLSSIDLSPSIHPTVDPSCKLTLFFQYQKFSTVIILPRWNHLQILIFSAAHPGPPFLSPYNLEHIFFHAYLQG